MKGKIFTHKKRVFEIRKTRGRWPYTAFEDGQEVENAAAHRLADLKEYLRHLAKGVPADKIIVSYKGLK